MEGIDNFNPIDFGGPTLDTRIRFEQAFGRLKQVASSVRTIEVEDIIGDADVRFGEITRDDLRPINVYRYDQLNDPLFRLDEDTYITFQITDGDPIKFDNWRGILGEHPLHSIHYEGPDCEVVYDASFNTEILYVTEPHDTSVSFMSDKFGDMMMDRINRHMQAMQLGAANPTEGSMRRLVEVLEREIAKRIIAQ